MFESVLISIRQNEGLKLKPYKCTENKLTIGYGRNLEDKGISLVEAEIMLNNDVTDVYTELLQKIDYFDILPIRVQSVLIEMAYQLGVSGLLKFKQTLLHIQNKDFESASVEMLDSKWAKQTPNRAIKMSNLMKGGN
jgi:lysozyme